VPPGHDELVFKKKAAKLELVNIPAKSCQSFFRRFPKNPEISDDMDYPTITQR
jgi:hypothetical protein